MYSPLIAEQQVLHQLPLESVLLRGISHQEKFSIDIGVTRPERQYVYRATLVDASIRQPYRLIMLEDKPTIIITPPHLDGMLAEIVKIHFNEDLEPLRLASDMNWELYKILYQELAR